MRDSINYGKVNPDFQRALVDTSRTVSTIDPQLKALLEVRVSQLNGCAYCLDMHAHEARQLGVPQQRLDCLVAWHESGLFDDAERAALAWADGLTTLDGDLEDRFEELASHFDEDEVVDITLTVSLMNTWNRIGVGFALQPRQRR